MIPVEYIVGAGALVGVALYIVFGGDLSFGFSDTVPVESNFSAVGLMNLGQTCFFNAVLQALVSCQSFCDWIARESAANSKHCHKTLCDLLHRIITNLKGGRGTDAVADTRTLARLLDEIRENGWLVGQSEQQDAHELFQAIMNLLHSSPEFDAWKDVTGPSFSQWVEHEARDEPQEGCRVSVIHKCRISQPIPMTMRTPMIGLVASSMTCKRCLIKNPVKYTAFTSLNLHFPPASAYRPYQLDDLLKYYFLSDNISDVDCENCSERCGSTVKCDFIREQSIGRMPRCLCLHVQRLGWYGYHEAMKRHDNVKFPAMLDMSCYSQLYKSITSRTTVNVFKEPSNIPSGAHESSDTHQGVPAGATDTNIPENNHVEDGLASKDQADPSVDPAKTNTSVKPSSTSASRKFQLPSKSGRGSSLYSLVSVIEHRGSEVSGHFVTYRKLNRQKGLWLYTSDLDVREVSAEHVHSRPPYMLFYERMDT